MTAWLRSTAPFLVDVAACAHGVDAAKSWLFATNVADLRSLASMCPHPPNHHPPLAGRRLPDGTFASRLTARYPDSLAAGLVSCLRAGITSSHGLAPVRNWSSLLPCSIQWPVPDSRVEDGAGTNSTACWSRPHGADIFGALRKQWTDRLIHSNLHTKISAALLSGSRSPPLTEDELSPFLSDLRTYLAITDERLWEACLSVSPGQPFRLALWRRLSGMLSDPDAEFLDLLPHGVPLGVDPAAPVPPSSVMPRSAASHASGALHLCVAERSLRPRHRRYTSC